MRQLVNVDPALDPRHEKPPPADRRGCFQQV